MAAHPMHSLELDSLDPKLDLVFKSLFTRRPALLIPLIEAVLQGHGSAGGRLGAPIASVELLSPGLPPGSLDPRDTTLDVHVRLDGGRQVILEMQPTPHPGIRDRATYSVLRMIGDQPEPNEHRELDPCAVIFFLGEAELDGSRLHSVFRPTEVRKRTVLTDVLEVHFVELPKLAHADPEDAALLPWCRFFAARNDGEREALARENPVLREVKDVLDEVSADPRLRDLARMREFGWAGFRLAVGQSRQRGFEDGHKEGRRQTLVDTVAIAADVLQLPFDDERRRRMSAWTTNELEAVLTEIRTLRHWPD